MMAKRVVPLILGIVAAAISSSRSSTIVAYPDKAMSDEDWKIAGNEAALERLDNWHKHIISDCRLTGTAFRLLGFVYLYCARREVTVCPVREIMDGMRDHDLATNRTIKRTHAQTIALGYLLPVGDTHVRVNPKLADAPPAHWLEVEHRA
jgi:hypothetical protein